MGISNEPALSIWSVDLLCSLDGVLRVKHNTLVVTREGGTQQKAKAKIIEGGWIWLDTTQYTPF